MIGGLAEHRGGRGLARHLAKDKANRSVAVRTHGLLASDVAGAISELRLLARGARTCKPVIHAWASPALSMAEDEWDAYWTRFEVEFELEGFPFVEVTHEKLGRGRTARHVHRVYLRVRPDRTAVKLSHGRARQEKVSRITEWETGQPFTKGRHNRAVSNALWAEGRSDVADAMEAAGLLAGPRPTAPTPAERACAERRCSLAPDEVWRRAYDAWRRTSSADALISELDAAGLVLARGETRVLLVAPGGVTYGLARAISAGARRCGAHTVRVADVARRLEGATLPELGEALALAAASDPGPARAVGWTRPTPARSDLPYDAGTEPMASPAAAVPSVAAVPAPAARGRGRPSEAAAPAMTEDAPLRLDPHQEALGRAVLRALLGGAAAEAEAIRLEIEAEACRAAAARPRPLAPRRAPGRGVVREQERRPALGLENDAPSISVVSRREAYKADVARLPAELAHLVRWVDRVEGAVRVLHLRSGTVVQAHDHVVTADAATDDTVMVMIGLALRRGWTRIEISGGTPEWRARMCAAAAAAGMVVAAVRPEPGPPPPPPADRAGAPRGPPGR